MPPIWNSRSTVTVHGYDLAIAARRKAMIDANVQHPASSALSLLGKCSVTSPISLPICTCVFKFVPTEDVVYSHISSPRRLWHQNVWVGRAAAHGTTSWWSVSWNCSRWKRINMKWSEKVQHIIMSLSLFVNTHLTANDFTSSVNLFELFGTRVPCRAAVPTR